CRPSKPAILMEAPVRDFNGDDLVTGRRYNLYVGDNQISEKSTSLYYEDWAGNPYPYAREVGIRGTLIVTLSNILAPESVGEIIYPSTSLYIRVNSYPNPQYNYLQFGAFSGYPVIGAKGGSTSCPECQWQLDTPLRIYAPMPGGSGYSNGIVNKYLDNAGYASRLKAFNPGEWLFWGTKTQPPRDLDRFIFVPFD
ncbi:hypothetical protein, partial [Bacillus cereus]|uniref:hypothetical protein n=1 Tax=Bacillus cereus TaxID=1396 RepID=UPI001C55248B